MGRWRGAAGAVPSRYGPDRQAWSARRWQDDWSGHWSGHRPGGPGRRWPVRRRVVHHLVRHPRHAAPLIALGTGLLMIFAGAVALAAVGAAVILPMMLFLMIVAQSRRARVVSAGPPAAAVAPPGPDWPRARAEFDRLRTAYAAYECDPLEVLRLPALADVTVPSTGRFVDAFAQAQALDTDERPGRAHTGEYVEAVGRATRAWQAARDAAERIRLAGLDPAERASVERVIKLLTMARDSDSDAERLTAYARARSELSRLARAGLRLPRPAQAALDAESRGQLPR